MTIYILNVYPEELQNNYRVIEIKPDQTFEDLHKGILNAFDVRKKKKNASFFLSDDSWTKGKELAVAEKGGEDVSPDALDGKKLSIKQYVKESKPNLVYVNDGLTQYTFRVELEKISEEGSAKSKYPRTIDSDGGPLETETDELFGEDISSELGDMFEDEDYGSSYSEEDFY